MGNKFTLWGISDDGVFAWQWEVNIWEISLTVGSKQLGNIVYQSGE
jgi:hypothetical protein